MTSQYRHRRTSNPATVFTNPLEPGEIAVNTANRQIAVGDAASGSTGAPLNLLAVQIFDTRAQYPINSFVTQAGVLYRSKVAVTPAAFDISQWEMMVGAVDTRYVEVAGDTMTGPLVLPSANPTLPVQAAHKGYVDTMLAAKSSVIVADAPPTPTPIDSTLWFDTLSGQLFIRYNDGNTTQWVTASPQPGVDQFVNKSGDSMSGRLVFADDQGIWWGDQSVAITGTGNGESVAIYTGGALKVAVNAAGTHVSDAITVPTPPLNEKSTVVATTEFVKTWAAPKDALAYSGLQTNGGCEVSQEFGTTGRVYLDGDYKYAIDGWNAYSYNIATGARSIKVQQVAATADTGYKNYISTIAAVGGTYTAPADTVVVQNMIEGYRIARLRWGTANAQPVTLAFWVGASIAGTFSLYLQNSGTGRSYVTPITINVAGVWEYKTITIPGDQAGTWLTNNGVGLVVGFASATAGAASSTLATPNTWTAGNKNTIASQTNFMATTNNIFNIMGLVVLPGIEAPTAAQSPLIMRPFDQELLTCMRYFQVVAEPGASRLLGNGHYLSAAQLDFPITFSHPMRSSPALLVSGGTAYFMSSRAGGNETFANFIAAVISPTGAWLYSLGMSGTVGAGATITYNNAAAKVSFDARL